MSIEIRSPVDLEWEAVCTVDGRAFGVVYSADEVEQLRPLHDLSRFRVAFDDAEMVAVAGSYALNVTLPGGSTVPAGGVTWVSTLATHRRRGLMRRVVQAVHDDIDERGEPLATLYASEGGIYERLGYGVGTQIRVASIDRRAARLRAEHQSSTGSVSYASGETVIEMLVERWARFRRVRAGEVDRDEADVRHTYEVRLKEIGAQSAAFYLIHPDGYAVYRIEQNWRDGHPAHTLHLVEFAAITAVAHLALWQTLLGVDLVSEIKSRVLALDDPLPYLLENPRVVRTVELNDGTWANVRDPTICFGARTYRTADRIVVEVDGKRWAIEGAPDGASCKAVRTRADLVTTPSAFGSLLYGGILPSTLVAGRRMTARNDDTLRRADLFFPTSLAPHCQSPY